MSYHTLNSDQYSKSYKGKTFFWFWKTRQKRQKWGYQILISYQKEMTLFKRESKKKITVCFLKVILFIGKSISIYIQTFLDSGYHSLKCLSDLCWLKIIASVNDCVFKFIKCLRLLIYRFLPDEAFIWVVFKFGNVFCYNWRMIGCSTVLHHRYRDHLYYSF